MFVTNLKETKAVINKHGFKDVFVWRQDFTEGIM